MKKIFLALILSLLLAGCGASNTNTDKLINEGEKGNEAPAVVRVGLTGSDSKVWTHVKEEAAKENIDIQLVFFDSYPLPNVALASGEIERKVL